MYIYIYTHTCTFIYIYYINKANINIERSRASEIRNLLSFTVNKNRSWGEFQIDPRNSLSFWCLAAVVGSSVLSVSSCCSHILSNAKNQYFHNLIPTFLFNLINLFLLFPLKLAKVTHCIYYLVFSHPKRRYCESVSLNIPANLENSAVATELEKVSFHSNPEERQCHRMFKLLHNCAHLTC